MMSVSSAKCSCESSVTSMLATRLVGARIEIVPSKTVVLATYAPLKLIWAGSTSVRTAPREVETIADRLLAMSGTTMLRWAVTRGFRLLSGASGDCSGA